MPAQDLALLEKLKAEQAAARPAAGGDVIAPNVANLTVWERIADWTAKALNWIGDLLAKFFDWLAGNHVSMSVEYDVTVPRSMDLNVDNTNGAIDISDVRGTLQVSDTNGHIELVRCAGSVEAETTNGAVRAELTEVTAGKSMRLETTNGRITVTVPRSIAARVDASTTNGSAIATTAAKRHSRTPR